MGEPGDAGPVSYPDLLDDFRGHDDELEESDAHRPINGAGIDLPVDDRANFGYVAAGDLHGRSAGGKKRA
jgi:hypothetical protein